MKKSNKRDDSGVPESVKPVSIKPSYSGGSNSGKTNLGIFDTLQKISGQGVEDTAALTERNLDIDSLEDEKTTLDVPGDFDKATIRMDDIGSGDAKEIERPDKSSFPVTAPVAGWFVVIDGPGKGSSLTIKIGQSWLGRAADEDITLAFGDSQVSRYKHARVTYDSKGNRFYVSPGEGSNLTYHLDGENESPVLAVTELKAGNRIRIGDTELLFVPLCNEDFSWG